jgi:hypothetical protein
VVVGTGAASAVVTVYNATSAANPVTIVDASGELSLNYGGLLLDAMHVTLTGGAAKATVVYS